MLYAVSALIQLLLIFQLSEEGYTDDDYFKTPREYVDKLKSYGQVKTREVTNAMLKVDRNLYYNRSLFEDVPLRPPADDTDRPASLIALALDTLSDFLVEGNSVLDVAGGSGYLAACMSYMVGKTGKVVVNQHDKNFTDIVKDNLDRANPDLMDGKRILFVEGPPFDGDPWNGPYNAIHVGVALKEVPSFVLDQLIFGGRMIVPVLGESGFDILVINKDDHDGESKRRKLYTVPLDSYTFAM